MPTLEKPRDAGFSVATRTGAAGAPRAGAPDASVIIPVNAQGDIDTLRETIANLQQYSGDHEFELVLVINNYPPEAPPSSISEFENAGFTVVATPDAHREGEVVILSARALGVEAARSEITIHFDADCRIPDVNAVLDWYIRTLRSGAKVAYTYVGFYDSPKKTAVYAKRFLHHSSRWIKRNILGIPTTRGSNYAIVRSLFKELYDAGKLSVDLHVGPAAKLAGAGIAYSGRRKLRVLTSGRRDSGRWGRLIPYFTHRLRYNLRATPTRRRTMMRGQWEGFEQENAQREELELPVRSTEE